jgi:hypothetical protein
MASEALLERDIVNGRILIAKLKAQLGERGPSAALWYIDPDEERYSLLLASPVYDEFGPIAAYKTIELAMNDIEPSERLSRGAIKAVSQNDPIMKGLRSKPDVNESWIHSTLLPGVYLHAGYVYFVDKARRIKRNAS